MYQKKKKGSFFLSKEGHVLRCLCFELLAAAKNCFFDLFAEVFVGGPTSWCAGACTTVFLLNLRTDCRTKKRWKIVDGSDVDGSVGALDEEDILAVAHNGAADPVSSTHTTKLLVKTKNVSQRLTFAKW